MFTSVAGRGLWGTDTQQQQGKCYLCMDGALGSQTRVVARGMQGLWAILGDTHREVTPLLAKMDTQKTQM